MIPLYDYAGAAIAYADDACQAIYLPDGRLAAWLDDGLLYTPDGRYLGWAQQGWILDPSGRAVLFADDARGLPAKPAVHPPAAALWPRPHRLPKRPLRRAARPARRARIPEWSALSGPGFFRQQNIRWGLPTQRHKSA
jgi:hypothetical protein